MGGENYNSPPGPSASHSGRHLQNKREADQIKSRVKEAQGHVNNLTQSILAKAFRGELTSQWREERPEPISGENSAEALLARIETEREQLAATNKKKGR